MPSNSTPYSSMPSHDGVGLDTAVSPLISSLPDSSFVVGRCYHHLPIAPASLRSAVPVAATGPLVTSRAPGPTLFLTSELAHPTQVRYGSLGAFIGVGRN